MRTIKEGFLRKNLGLGREELIKRWLDDHNIKNYRINKDLTIDVNDDVSIFANELDDGKLPDFIQFDKVVGNFSIFDFKLGGYYIYSLTGCPKHVYGNFTVRAKELDTLEGCPEEVGGSFHCKYNDSLKSLEYCPKKVGGNFYCHRNKNKFTTKSVKKYCNVNGEIINVLELEHL